MNRRTHITSTNCTIVCDIFVFSDRLLTHIITDTCGTHRRAHRWCERRSSPLRVRARVRTRATTCRYVASWLSKNLEYGVARYLSLLGFPQSEAVMRCVFLHAEEVIRKMREAKYFGSTCTLVMGVSTEKSAKDAPNAGAAASSPQDIDLKLVVGHLGEGLALTIHRNGSLREVTEAHTPLHEAERLRVERAGGAALIRTKPGGSCLKPTEIVDHSFPPTFQPGRLGVSRCLGGMKAKMSFDPPFVLSEPEVFTIDITRSTSNADRSAAGTSSSSGSAGSSASSDAASDIYGCLVISDGVYSYKGARLNASKLESLVKPIITGMNTKLDALSDDGGARSLFATAAADIKDTVIKAATQAQVKIGEGDNISVAVIMVADR